MEQQLQFGYLNSFDSQITAGVLILLTQRVN